ncbi:hypothetical protein [Pantoea agglomerans]
MDINMKRSAAAALLLCAAMSSHAASVESEVKATDTVVIGAASEKVTLRVTGFKNLTGSEGSYGNFYASTTSALGQLAITMAPEHKPELMYSNTMGALKGVIKNEAGDSFSVAATPYASTYKVISGTPWLFYTNSVTGSLGQAVSQKLNPGVYRITLRAALYQQ